MVLGLEVGSARPADFLTRHCKKIGEDYDDLGTFVGSILGTVFAVPGLLIGAVVGLGRIIYKFPEAVRTCWGDGVNAALCQTADSYEIDPQRTLFAVRSIMIIAVIAIILVLATPAFIYVFAPVSFMCTIL
jgi:hypothetical protein